MHRVRHVINRIIECHLTQETRAQNACDDVASTIYQTLPREERVHARRCHRLAAQLGRLPAGRA